MATNLSFANSLFIRFLNVEATDAQRLALTQEIADLQKEDPAYSSFDATADFVNNQFDTQHSGGIEQHILDYYAEFSQTPALTALLNWTDQNPSINSSEASELKGLLVYDVYAQELNELANPLSIDSPTQSDSPENEPLDYTVTASGVNQQFIRYSLLTDFKDSEFFNIDARSGKLSFKETPDFEDKSNYTVIVVATNADTLVDTFKEITIDITGVNESPEFTNPTTIANVDEDSTQVFYTATASDPDNDALTFSIGNNSANDNSLFSIGKETGALKFRDKQDFEVDDNSGRVYVVDITVTDNNIDKPVTQQILVSLNNINEAPEFTSATTATGNESSTEPFYTATAIDPDADELSFALGNQANNDNSLFVIDEVTGALSFIDEQDIQADDESVFLVDIEVTDNIIDQAITQQVSVSLNNTNDAPEFTSADTASAPENTTAPFYIATASDPDDDSLTFSINNQEDNDNRFFSIDAETGQLAFKDKVNFEANNASRIFLVDIAVTDNIAEPVVQQISVTLRNINETPIFTSAATASVDENSTQAFYTATASDPERNTLTFAINNQVDKDNSLFIIDAVSGQLRFKNSQDFEAAENDNGNRVYRVDITVSDGSTLPPVLQEVSITINDISDPVLTLSTLDGNSALTVTEGDIAEYKVALTSGNIKAGDTLSFTLEAKDGIPPFGAVNPEDFSGLNVSDTTSYTFTQTFDQELVAGAEIFSFNLQTEEDNELEETEAFSIELNSASLSSASLPSPLNVVSTGSPLITQIENKRAPELTLSALDGSDTLIVTEGEIAEYKVTLSHGHIQAGETLSFTLDALDGLPPFGAVNPDDFSGLNVSDTNTFTFSQTFDEAATTGDEIFSFSLQTEEDNELENTEAFSIELNAATLSGVSLPSPLDVVGLGSPLVTQIENLRAPEITLSALDGIGTLTVTEGEIAEYKVTLSHGHIQAGETLSFTLDALDGLPPFGAVNPDDFAGLNISDTTTYTFTQTFDESVSTGDEIFSFSLQTEEDNELEDTEAFSIELNSATLSGASLLSPLDVVSNGSPLVTQIENLRAPELTLSALDGSDTLIVTEGEIAEYKVTLSHGHIQVGETLSFTLDALDGLSPFGAVNPDDFSELNVSETTTYTFTQTFDQAMSTGDEIFSFSLLTEEDNELEDTEAFSIELNASTLSGASLPSPLDVVSNGSPLITQIENQIRTYTFALSGDSNATEGNNANYSIHLTGDNILRGSIVELVLQTSDGDALNPDDFSDLVGANYDTDTKTLTLSGPVSSSALDPIANLRIAIVNDRLNESAEDFRVELVSATVDSQAANISVATVTTTIAANDFDTTAPTVIANQIAEYLENRLSSEVLYQVQANDITADPNDFESGIANFQIDNGNNAGYFQIDAAGNIRLTVAGADGITNDFESLPNTFTLGISAIDNVGNQSATRSVTLNVIDIIEIFAFTTGIDSLIGTDFDDTFIADNTIDQVTSLAEGADGGTGNDTIQMTVDSVNDIVIPDFIQNIENFNINGSGGRLFENADFSSLAVNTVLLSSFDLDGSGNRTLTLGSGQALILENIIEGTRATPVLSLSALDGSNQLIVTEGDLAEYKVTLTSGFIDAGETLEFTLDALDGAGAFGAVNPADFASIMGLGNDFDLNTGIFSRTFTQNVVQGDIIFDFSLQIEQDSELEPTEAFTIDLNSAAIMNLTPDSPINVATTGSPLTTQIEDLRLVPEISLSAQDGSSELFVMEGGVAAYKVVLTNGSIEAGETLEFSLAAIDGVGNFAAVNPDDFDNIIVGADFDMNTGLFSRTFTQAVAQGDEIFNFSLETVGDNLNEGTESFSIELNTATITGPSLGGPINVIENGSPLTTHIEEFPIALTLSTLDGSGGLFIDEGNTAEYKVVLSTGTIEAGEILEFSLKALDGLGGAINPDDFANIISSTSDFDVNTGIFRRTLSQAITQGDEIFNFSIDIVEDADDSEGIEAFSIELNSATVTNPLVGNAVGIGTNGTPLTTQIEDAIRIAPVLEFTSDSIGNVIEGEFINFDVNLQSGYIKAGEILSFTVGDVDGVGPFSAVNPDDFYFQGFTYSGGVISSFDSTNAPTITLTFAQTVIVDDDFITRLSFFIEEDFISEGIESFDSILESATITSPSLSIPIDVVTVGSPITTQIEDLARVTPELMLYSYSSVVTEGDNYVYFEVYLENGRILAGETLTLTLDVLDDTAIAPGDFTFPEYNINGDIDLVTNSDGTISLTFNETILAGEGWLFEVWVDINEDFTREDIESFTTIMESATITSPSLTFPIDVATFGSPIVTDIEDAPIELTLSTINGDSELFVAEGDTAEYQVILSNGSIAVGETLEFTLETVNGLGISGAISPDDFADILGVGSDFDVITGIFSHTFTQAVGQDDSIFEFSIDTQSDTSNEGIESFTIGLSAATVDNPVFNAPFGVGINGSPFTTYIEDDPVTLTLSTLDGSDALLITEGDTAEYKVVLTSGSIFAGETLEFSLEAIDGVGNFGAVNPDDFANIMGVGTDYDLNTGLFSRTFTQSVVPGQSIFEFSLDTVVDTLQEDTEAFTIDLHSAGLINSSLNFIDVFSIGSPLTTQIENISIPTDNSLDIAQDIGQTVLNLTANGLGAIGDEPTINLEGSGLTTLNIFTTGAPSYFNLQQTGTALDTINFNGNQPIELYSSKTANGIPVDSHFNASSSSNITINAENNNSGVFSSLIFNNHVLNITGSSGDDKFIINDTDIIDGGAGFDRVQFGTFDNDQNLAISSPVSALNLLDDNLINVERINIRGGSGETYDFSVQTEDLYISSTTSLNGDNIIGQTIYGGSGNDTIEGDGNNDTFNGGLGEDTFSVGFGNRFGRLASDTIEDFSVAEQDKIDSDFEGTLVLNVTNPTALQSIVSASLGDIEILQANSGLVLIDNSNANVKDALSLSTTDVANYLSNIEDGIGTDSVVFEHFDSLFYLLVSDGTDSALFEADAAAGNSNNTIDANELTLIATLEGISDAGSLSGSFVEFL